MSSRVKTAKRGAKAFGQALLGPFTHAGGVLWLEITGLFFALFAVFFVQSVYRVHTAWRQGPEHTHLLLYAVLAFVFGWFSVSSFTRAYRKSKRGPKLGNSGRS
jgi:Na+/H+-translocating membrane pyrophosphatase